MLRRSLLTLLLLLLPPGLLGEQDERALFEIIIAQLQRDGMEASNLRMQLRTDGYSASLSAAVDELRLPGQPEPLRGVRLDCPVARISWPAVTCEKALLQATESPWGGQQVEVALDWQSARQWQLKFSGLRYAGDSLSGQLDMQQGEWTLQVGAKGLRLAKIDPLQAARAEVGLQSLGGVLAVAATVRGDADGVREVKASGGLSRLAWADTDGLQAAENLKARYDLKARLRGGDWSGRAVLRLLGGEAYSDPVFLDFKAHPVRFEAQGSWRPGRERLLLRRVKLDGGRMLQLGGELEVDLHKGIPLDGRLRVELADLAAGYTNLLQPLLIGTELDELEIAGDASAELRWRGGQPVFAEARIGRLDMDHQYGGFGAYGLSADLHWRADEDAPDSRVAFTSAHLGKLEFGASQARFHARGPYLHLLEPVSLPFYEGSVDIRDLTLLRHDEGVESGFSVALSGVSLEQLSMALGWPGMGGSIDGVLPRARFADDSLQVAGDIEIQAFDGRMWLRGLRLDQLSSVAPVLRAELELKGLDLAKVTETFSFGKILGRLDGEVRDLQLVGWQPNRFSARFYSPEDDDLPHRISQDAVADLTELGNGVSGALSSTFLRFFEEFSYDRVELKVTQRGDRAEIDGIPHSGGGYYLVKGAGIPRIDVIGRNREVAWKDLVGRLKSIRFDGIEIQ